MKRTEEKQGTLRWDKLDNTAHVFPVIAGNEMTNVYRISVVLKEEVQQDLLQQALDIVLPKFEIFHVRLRQGIFWYYFEENVKRAPRVHEEETYPCRYIVQNKNRSYLFRVTYYKKRINLEVFHVLTCSIRKAAQLLTAALPYRCGNFASLSTDSNGEASLLPRFYITLNALIFGRIVTGTAWRWKPPDRYARWPQRTWKPRTDT